MKQISDEQKASILNYKKAKTLLEKLITMTEEGAYCIDLMQQNLAVIGLLKSVHHKLLAQHLNSCFKKAMATNNEKRKSEMIDEILAVSKLTLK